MLPGPVHDIEELVRVMEKAGCCPYFAAQALLKEAQLVIGAYGYGLDPTVRGGLFNFTATDIVIFDEAHNIEDACRDAASLDTSAKELQAATQELQAAAKRVLPNVPCAAAAKCLADLFKRLRVWLETRLNNQVQVDNLVVELTGVLALDMLAEARVLDPALLAAAVSAYRVVCSADSDLFREKLMSLVGRQLLVFEYMMDKDRKDAPKFRVQLRKDPGGVGQSEQLGFWCLDPAVAFGPLAKACGSVILTSGTLSGGPRPSQQRGGGGGGAAVLASLEAMLGTRFPHQLVNSLEVDQTQLWAGLVMKGPGDVALGSHFENRTPGARASLGSALVDLCSKVPNGALCFFVSYAEMNECVRCWKTESGESGGQAWDALRRAKPSIFVEGCEIAEQFADFPAQFLAFKAAASSGKGALYLCVYRGKLSEGVNFTDEMARGLFLTGIPYMPKGDAKVKAKMKYQDMASSRWRQATDTQATGTPEPEPLTGSQWYTQQAFRAVNQAIGRCIRHPNDYGAVVLLDARFAGDTLRELPSWMQNQVKTVTLGEAVLSLSDFFEQERQPVNKNNKRPRVEPATGTQEAAAPTQESPAGEVERAIGEILDRVTALAARMTPEQGKLFSKGVVGRVLEKFI
jgi:Rad3-related DNA helicase